MGVGTRRRFGGKDFTLYEIFKYKKNADNTASWLRRVGYYVRVVKRKLKDGGHAYLVYRRRKK